MVLNHINNERTGYRMNYLIVVDMQNDFIDGALGTKEAQAIVANVVRKVDGFAGEVIFTRDTHQENYLDTQEGRNLPVKHCVEGTPGWEIADALKRYCGNAPVDKPTFGSVELGKYLSEKNDAESVTLVGLCTDICVISNALLIKAFMPEVPVRVDSSCCAGVTPESHRNALEAMRMCQIEIL